MKIVAMTFALAMIIFGNLSYAFECQSWPFEGMPYFFAKTDNLVLYSTPSSSAPFTEPIKIEKGSIVTFSYGVKEIIGRRKEREQRRQDAIYKSMDLQADFSFTISGVLNKGGARDRNEVIVPAENPDDKRPISTEIILDKSIQKTIQPGFTTTTTNGTFKATESYGRISSCAEIDKERTEYDKEYTFQKGDTIEYLLYLGENVCLFRFHGDVFMDHGCLGYLNEAFWPKEERCLKREYAENFESRAKHQVEWWISIKQNDKVLGWTLIDKNNKMLEMIDTLK